MPNWITPFENNNPDICVCVCIYLHVCMFRGDVRMFQYIGEKPNNANSGGGGGGSYTSVFTSLMSRITHNGQWMRLGGMRRAIVHNGCPPPPPPPGIVCNSARYASVFVNNAQAI